MNTPKQSRSLLSILGASGALSLAAVLAGCEGMAKPLHPHYNKDTVQHWYDTGQISYTEYADMMKSMNANWTPGAPPAADPQFNDNPLRPTGTPGGTTP